MHISRRHTSPFKCMMLWSSVIQRQASDNSVKPIDIKWQILYNHKIVSRQKSSQVKRRGEARPSDTHCFIWPRTQSVSLIHKFGFTSLAVVKTALMLMALFLLLGNGFVRNTPTNHTWRNKGLLAIKGVFTEISLKRYK